MLDGGGWLTSRPGRFTPGKDTLYPLHRGLSGLVSRSGLVRKISAPTGIRSPDRKAHSKSPRLRTLRNTGLKCSQNCSDFLLFYLSCLHYSRRGKLWKWFISIWIDTPYGCLCSSHGPQHILFSFSPHDDAIWRILLPLPYSCFCPAVWIWHSVCVLHTQLPTEVTFTIEWSFKGQTNRATFDKLISLLELLNFMGNSLKCNNKFFYVLHYTSWDKMVYEGVYRTILSCFQTKGCTK